MAYEVLARKWRPDRFATMVGQEHVLRALVHALEADRLHHAYLFTGTRGVGKTTVARILARCLNCERGVGPEPCGECTSCTEIAEGRFVDLIEVDAASRTRVEDTRELLDNVQYAPTRGRYKVYLIDEVHMLSTSSFNALLKTLEEPPPHVKFLLATTDPKKLPVTVLSRCLQFHLKNLTPERIVAHLEHVLGAEGVEAETAALWALARAADGSMRDALSLTDQAVAHGGGRLAADEVARMLGTIDQGALERILGALADGDGDALVTCCDDLATHAADFAGVLRELMSALHQLAVAQALPDRTPAGDERAARLAVLANRLGPEDVQLCYQIALTGLRDLAWAPDPRTGFEMTLLRMLAFRPDDGSGPGGGRRASTERGTAADAQGPSSSQASDPASAPTGGGGVEAGPPHVRPADAPGARALAAVLDAPVPAMSAAEHLAPEPASVGESVPASRPALKVVRERSPDPEPEASAGAAQEQEVTPPLPPPPFVLAEDWHGVLAALDLSGMTRELATHCLPSTIDGYRVEFALDPTAESLLADVHVARLERGLSELFSAEWRVRIVAEPPAGETPAQRAARERAARQQRAVESIEQDPHVRRLQEVFDASIQADSIRPRG